MITFEEIENQRVGKEIRDKKEATDKQNEAIGRMRDNSKMALLTRYNEMNQKERIETVKLPLIYQRKTAAERDDDSFGLLKNFQDLLSTRLVS